MARETIYFVQAFNAGREETESLCFYRLQNRDQQAALIKFGVVSQA